MKGQAAAYKATRASPTSNLSGWKLCGDAQAVLAAANEQAFAELAEYYELQGGLGEYYGNVCGFVAAARVLRLLGELASPRHYPHSDAWTGCDQLEEYLQRTVACRQRSFSHAGGERFDYRDAVRKAIDSGHPAIVLLCLGSMTKMHYVVVVGHKDDDFLVLDWSGGREVAFTYSSEQFFELSYNPAPFYDAYRLFECEKK